MSDFISTKRQEIDSIDQRLVELLDKRADVARELQIAKTKDGKAVSFDPAREEEIMSGLGKFHQGSFPKKALSAVFSEIVSACRNIELHDRIAVLGEKFGWIHDAAVRRFGSSAVLNTMENGEEILQALLREESHMGFFPVSSCCTDFHQLLEAFMAGKIFITSEVNYLHRFALVSRNVSERNSITDLFVTRETLGLLRQWVLSISFPIKINICRSVEEVLENLVESKPNAGLISETIAGSFGANLIETCLEPLIPWPIRCVTIARVPNAKIQKGMKVSVLLALQHEPGTLYNTLAYLREAELNLLGIDTFKFHEKAWQELFLVDFEAPENEARLSEILKAMKAKSRFFKFLGAYPALK